MALHARPLNADVFGMRESFSPPTRSRGRLVALLAASALAVAAGGVAGSKAVGAALGSDRADWAGGDFPVGPTRVEVPRLRALPFDETRLRAVTAALGLRPPKSVRAETVSTNAIAMRVDEPYRVVASRNGSVWSFSLVDIAARGSVAPAEEAARRTAFAALDAVGLSRAQWDLSPRDGGRGGSVTFAVTPRPAGLPVATGNLGGSIEVSAGGVSRLFVLLVRLAPGEPVPVVDARTAFERVRRDPQAPRRTDAARLVLTAPAGGFGALRDGELLAPAWEFSATASPGEGVLAPAKG